MNYNVKYLQGALWFILSLLVSSSGDVLMKHLGANVHPYQVVFLRFLCATILLTPWFYFKSSSFATKRLPLHFVRGALLFGGISFWCMGLNVVKIALATTINFTIPIFVAALAVIFLREKFSVFRLAATVLGFIGIIFAMNPASSDFNLVSVSLLFSAFLFATLDVINKKFVTDESTMSMLFYSNVFTTLLSFVPAMYVWVSISFLDVLLFLLLGAVANLILFFLLKAFELVDASAVAPYRYVELIFSSTLGYVFFREVIDSHIVLGAVVIIAATLFVLYEGLLRKRIRSN